MPNARYSKANEALLNGEIDWLNDTIKAVLINVSEYSVNLSADEFLSDIPSAARVKTSPAFTGKTATSGVADADDIVFSSVTGATGATCAAYVIFQDAAGILAKSRLIAYCDTGTGLPITPNGGDINIVFPSVATKIFKL